MSQATHYGNHVMWIIIWSWITITSAQETTASEFSIPHTTGNTLDSATNADFLTTINAGFPTTTTSVPESCQFGYKPYGWFNCQPCLLQNCATCTCDTVNSNCSCITCFDGNSPDGSGICSDDNYGNECFNSSTVSSAIQLCDSIQNNLYSYGVYDYCWISSAILQCYYKQLHEKCGIQTAKAQLVKIIVTQQFETWTISCSLDWTAITNLTGQTCDERDSFSCLPNIYDLIIKMQMVFSRNNQFMNGSEFCSYWESPQTCSIDQTKCSLQASINAVQQRASEGSYWLQPLTVLASCFETFCKPGSSSNQCMLSDAFVRSAEKCAAIFSFKRTYMISYNDPSHQQQICAYGIREQACIYNASVGQCGEATFQLLFDVWLKVRELFDSFYQNCIIDWNAVKAENFTDDSSDQLLYCSSKTSLRDGFVHWQFLESLQSYSEPLQQLNMNWTIFTDCMRCNSDKECVDALKNYFQPRVVKQLSNDYNYYNYLTTSQGHLTLYKLYLANDFSEDDWRSFIPCFQSLGQYRFQCSLEVVGQPVYSNCKYFTDLFLCLFDKISTACSLRAARFYVELRFDDAYEYYKLNNNCTMDITDILPACNETSCLGDLTVSAVNQYKTNLLAGSLTPNDLTNLCEFAAHTSHCVQRQEQLCDLELYKYRALIAEIVPSFCSNDSHAGAVNSQHCITASSSVQTALTTFFQQTQTAEAYCRSSRILLADVYNALSVSCNSSAFDTILTYAAHLQQLLFVVSNVTVNENCSNSLYPNVNSPPQFTGPHVIENVFYNGAGPYKDFYFVCQVNYTQLTADDGSRFDVYLVADGQIQSEMRTTNATHVNVEITSQDLLGKFGKNISCATRSYWANQPLVKSDLVVSSRSYFVGMSVISYATVSYNQYTVVQIYESTPQETVFFQPTVPITCPPCSLTVRITRHVGLVVSTCSLTFTASETPFTNKSVQFRAVQTPGSNSRILSLEFADLSTEISGSGWDAYKIRRVNVMVVDRVSGSFCSSCGDPHISTFDGVYLNVYFVGDFIMWRRYGVNFLDIQARTFMCGSTVACHCAVVVREDNNVLGLNGCGNGGLIPINYLSTSDGAGIQASADGYTYTITMPSGTYVVVQAYCSYGSPCYMCLTIYPSSDDGQSEGLCGNRNGDPDDDYIIRDTNLKDQLYEPVKFANSYTVAADKSLLNGHIYQPPCIEINVTLPTVCDCENNTVSGCASLSAESKTVNSVKVFRTQGTNSCLRSRRKRDVTSSSKSADVIYPEDIPVPDAVPAPDKPLHGNVSWPTPSGITEQQAWRSCSEQILQSPLYSQCANFTADQFDSIVRACVEDVQLTEDIEKYVRGILTQFQRTCVHQILRSDNTTVDEVVETFLTNNSTDNTTDSSDIPQINRDSLFSPAVQSLLQSVAQQLCYGEPACTGNGTCQNGTCVCNEGHIGADCSLLENEPPVIRGLRRGPVCDKAQPNTNCLEIFIFAEQFTISSFFVCRIKNGETQVFYASGTLQSSIEVQCAFPTDLQMISAYSQWTVDISNNNSTFSNSVQLLVFDSQCINCTTNDSSSCSQKRRTCLIDGICYQAGDTNELDFCCDPSHSNTSWTNDSGICFPTTTENISTKTLTVEYTSTKTPPVTKAPAKSSPTNTVKRLLSRCISSRFRKRNLRLCVPLLCKKSKQYKRRNATRCKRIAG